MSLARRWYERSPIWIQNLACTAVGAKNRWERYNRHFWKYLSWLEESQWWPRERIQAYQDERLRALVQYAYRSVPFYRGWFDGCGVRPEDIRTQADLARLPILTKQIVRENRAQLVSSEASRRRLLRSLTSGTTGTALEIWSTREARAFQWAIWWRHRARFGLRPGDRYLTFGARVPVPAGQERPPFWRRNWIGRQTYLSTYHMTPRHLPAIVEWLQSERFDFFFAYPSALHVLACHMEQHGLRLRCPPRCLVCGSDALLPAFEARFKRVFEVPVTETYGMAEFAGNMSKCEHGRFHLDFECCCVETQSIPGAPSGQENLILTGWGNAAMPFIRYEVGDYGGRCHAACTCGRQSECFEGVEGRTEDYVRTPDGRMAVGMNLVFEHAPGAREIQIYQDSTEEIEVRVVPGQTYSPSDETALLRELRRRLGDQIRIRFVQVESIARSSNGKFRAVISRLN